VFSVLSIDFLLIKDNSFIDFDSAVAVLKMSLRAVGLQAAATLV
jgi:hypothetical protein